jgi:hypothetical protein
MWSSELFVLNLTNLSPRLPFLVDSIFVGALISLLPSVNRSFYVLAQPVVIQFVVLSWESLGSVDAVRR